MLTVLIVATAAVALAPAVWFPWWLMSDLFEPRPQPVRISGERR